MSHIKKIKQVSSQVYRQMGRHSQVVIDLVEYLEGETSQDDDPVDSMSIGSFMYDTENLLDVFNPARQADIQVLKSLNAILEEWYVELLFIEKLEHDANPG